MSIWPWAGRSAPCCGWRQLTTSLLLGLLGSTAQAQIVPSYAEVRAAYRSSETQILDHDGRLLQRIRTDASVRRGPWVSLRKVSSALRTALVLSEDRRFYEHSGVDWAAVSAAAWANLFNQRTRGASTISMQLAGLLADGARPRSGQRSLLDKTQQVLIAQVLDRRWRKDQILEAYLNLLPWRGEQVGIAALSYSLFGKAPHGLNAQEAAIAAALVRAPNASPARVAQRACGVWRQMQVPRTTGADTAQTAPADCTMLPMLTQAALQRRAYVPSAGLAPHAARWALRLQAPDAGQAAPARIRTTLDAQLQQLAQQTLERNLRELQGRNVNDGAVVVLDNASGAVLAYVGSSGPLSQAREVDAVTALRQPGSTLKPFLYAQAIAEQRLTAASLLHDAPTHIATTGGLYIPQNYDHHFKGWISARTALASSLNIPAVRVLVMVSPERFAWQLRKLGLPLKETGDYYGYSLALGSAEVSLLNLTNAYRSLANGGLYSPVHLLPAANTDQGTRAGAAPAPRHASSGQRVLDPRAAYIVGDILSDAHARALTFGSDSVLSTRFWSAVKTGTSKDMRDNWAIGWSSRYTVGVWVGNAEGQAMWEVSGTSGAAPVWAEIMQALHHRHPSRAPTAPAGLHQQVVRFTDEPRAGAAPAVAREAARQEWFIAGTEQAVFSAPQSAATASSTASEGPARILAPVNGTLIALDPDIPPTHQRLRLQAQGPDPRWRLDGQPLGRGTELQWLPQPGRHRLELVTAKGTVLDAITLEVRGAGLRTARP
jgi:penicillin-binding protein 1C